MQKTLLTLLLSVSFTLSSFAQRNYHQELINLVEQGKCFEAREFRSQYADKLPSNDRTFDIFYKAHVALFFNKPDSAAIYLEDLISNHELKIGPGIGTYYGKLLTVYDSKQQFKDAIKVCDKYIDRLKRNPFDQDQEFIRNEMTSIENTKKTLQYRDANEPRIKIKRDGSVKDKTIKMNDGDFLRFNAMYNNVTAETWFNTSATTYFMITRGLANKIGTKLINKNQDSVQTIDGVKRTARVEVIDSIDFAGLKLYNIPALVINENIMPPLPDTLKDEIKSKIEKEFKEVQIMMGLPAMKLIGRIVFDYKKRTVSFPGRAEKAETNDASNMCLCNNNLGLKLKINELNYVGHLNTGSYDFLNISYPFYEKNKSRIEIDTITQKKPINLYTTAGTSFNVPYELVKNVKVSFNNRLINSNNGEVLVQGDAQHSIYEGAVGVKFFTMPNSKTLFDFDNMVVKTTIK
ncbi:aspartyl protease family protein [Arcticibacter tournemirensis]